jgi:hypothetical protein
LGFPLLGLQNPKPYALSNAAALLTFSIHAQRSENTSKLVRPVERPNMAPSPSRPSTSDPVQLVRRGLADYPSGSLLGVVFLEVFCASPVASPFRPASPPVLRRLASKLTWRRHLRVSTDIALNQDSFEPNQPPRSLLPRHPVSTLWRARRMGHIFYPQAPLDVTIEQKTLLTRRQPLCPGWGFR